MKFFVLHLSREMKVSWETKLNLRFSPFFPRFVPERGEDTSNVKFASG